MAAAPIWGAGLLLPAAVAGLVLLACNAPLYFFFYRRRGFLFALAAIPWHWLYYGYSGLGFALGLLYHLVRPLPRKDRQ